MVTNYGRVIHYWNGMALCEDVWGDLYYLEIPEGLLDLGEVVKFDDLTPIEALGADAEQAARAALEEAPQDLLDWAREVHIDLPGE